jgi:hypothetical protein
VIFPAVQRHPLACEALLQLRRNLFDQRRAAARTSMRCLKLLILGCALLAATRVEADEWETAAPSATLRPVLQAVGSAFIGGAFHKYVVRRKERAVEKSRRKQHAEQMAAKQQLHETCQRYLKAVNDKIEVRIAPALCFYCIKRRLCCLI